MIHTHGFTMSRCAAGAALLLLLGSCVRVTTMAQGDSTRPGREVTKTGIDTVQVRRWAELFSYVLREFRADRRDPVANIEGDFSTRLIHVRLTSGDEAWASQELRVSELATADLVAMAKELYARAKPRL